MMTKEQEAPTTSKRIKPAAERKRECVRGGLGKMITSETYDPPNPHPFLTPPPAIVTVKALAITDATQRYQASENPPPAAEPHHRAKGSVCISCAFCPRDITTTTPVYCVPSRSLARCQYRSRPNDINYSVIAANPVTGAERDASNSCYGRGYAQRAIIWRSRSVAHIGVTKSS